MLVAELRDELLQLGVEGLGLQAAFDAGAGASDEARPVAPVEVGVDVEVVDGVDESLKNLRLLGGGERRAGLESGLGCARRRIGGERPALAARRDVKAGARRLGRRGDGLGACSPERNRPREGWQEKKSQQRAFQVHGASPEWKSVEPAIGLEPMTCRLRIGCSTTELRRPVHKLARPREKGLVPFQLGGAISAEREVAQSLRIGP